MTLDQEQQMNREIEQALIESTSAAEFHKRVAEIRTKYGQHVPV